MYYLNLYGNLIKKDLYSYINLEFLKSIQTSAVKKDKYKNYPFLLYDMRMYFDIIILDWDEKNGILKNNAIEIIKTFLRSNLEIKGIRKKDLCFKIYESDRGVHAYLVSHNLNDIENDSLLLLQMYLLSDYKYIAVSRDGGSNIRLTPKFDIENGDKDFIQKKGLMYKGKKVKYIGNKKNIDINLDNLTKLLYKTQKFIKSQPNLSEKLVKEEIFHNLVKKYMCELYDLKYRKLE